LTREQIESTQKQNAAAIFPKDPGVQFENGEVKMEPAGAR
jgi:hypothetical protein